MRRLTLCLAGCLGLVAACASDDNRPVSAEEYDDIALAIGTVTAMHGSEGELAALGDVAQLVGGTVPDGCALDPDGTVHRERGGLAYHYTATCWDAAAARLDACDARTDVASVQVEFGGDVALPLVQLSLDRSGEWTLRDVTSARPHLVGASELSFDATITSPDRGAVSTYHLVTTADYEGVEPDARPTGGTIHLAISADLARVTDNRTHARSFDVDARITFLSNGHAVIDLDGVRRYDLDLATGVVLRLS